LPSKDSKPPGAVQPQIEDEPGAFLKSEESIAGIPAIFSKQGLGTFLFGAI
jgi:hypothetical protein